jgi:hypothetical protein
MFSIVKVWTNSAANFGYCPLWGTVQLSTNTGSYVCVDDRRVSNGRTNMLIHVVFGGANNVAQTSVSHTRNHTWVTGEYGLLSLASDPNASLAANRSIIRTNGTLVSQVNTVTAASKTGNPAYTLDIGHFGGVTGYDRMVGAFAEIVFLKGTISDDDRQKMEGYLVWKWGMQSQLPTNHKYKDAAPTVKDKCTLIMMR